MPGILSFNSKRITSTNRAITLGSMLVCNGQIGAGSSKRLYNWIQTKSECQGNPIECIWGISKGQWGPPTYPFNHYYPYYSNSMYYFRSK